MINFSAWNYTPIKHDKKDFCKILDLVGSLPYMEKIGRTGNIYTITISVIFGVFSYNNLVENFLWDQNFHRTFILHYLYVLKISKHSGILEVVYCHLTFLSCLVFIKFYENRIFMIF